MGVLILPRSKSLKMLASTMILTAALIAGGPAVRAETPADTLVIANTIDDLKVLDPAESFEFSGGDVINNLYDKLIDLDPATLEMGPGIAKSWDVSDDGKTFAFKIDTSRTFASGNPVRAEDVVWSLQRVVKLDKTPSFIISQFGLTKDNVEENVKAVDDETVTITVDRSYAPSFLYNALTADVASILDKELVMENASGDDMGNEWLKTHSAGAGPFVLRQWKPNESVIMEKSETYPTDIAMNRVYVRHVPEPATQRLLLERGDVDIARNLTPEDIAAVESNDALKVFEQPRGRIYYVSGNQTNDILSKPGVMQAIKYLVDYDGIAQSLLKGQVVVNQQFLPSGFLGAIDDKPFNLDVEKAKQLLADAGYPDGFEIELLVRNAQDRLAIAQSIQNTLAQAGITASIRPATGAEVLSIYRARNHQLTLEVWGPDYPDPNTNASVFAENPDNSESAQLTGNLSWRNAYAATETTPMAEAAVVERDTNKRRQMYEEMQRIGNEQSPFVLMFQQQEQDGMAKNVEGFSTGGAVSSAFYKAVIKTSGE